MRLKQAYIICLLFFVLLCFLIPTDRGYDEHFWIEWANRMRETGIGGAYSIPGLNYNPLYLYVIRAYQWVTGSPDAIAANINYLKIFTLLFDVGAIMLLIHWLNKNGHNYLFSFFILFNISYLYNTLFWGQIDAIHTTMLFAALILGLQEQLIWSVALFLIALNTKTQSILFLPILGLLWAPLLKGNGKAIVKGLALLIAIQIIIILPFLLKGTAIDVWNNYNGVVDYNSLLSMHANNYWYIMLWDNHEEPRIISDLNMWLGITYKTWGLIMFLGASTIALFPLLLKCVIALIKSTRHAFAQAEQYMLTATLITLIFFFFPTQMHERYSHPAILFSGVYFILSRRWVIFFLISYAYVMNLESLNKGWDWDNYRTFIFDARLIAIIYALAMAIGIYRLYKDYGVLADWKYLKNTFAKKAIA